MLQSLGFQSFIIVVFTIFMLNIGKYLVERNLNKFIRLYKYFLFTLGCIIIGYAIYFFIYGWDVGLDSYQPGKYTGTATFAILIIKIWPYLLFLFGILIVLYTLEHKKIFGKINKISEEICKNKRISSILTPVLGISAMAGIGFLVFIIAYWIDYINSTMLFFHAILIGWYANKTSVENEKNGGLYAILYHIPIIVLTLMIVYFSKQKLSFHLKDLLYIITVVAVWFIVKAENRYPSQFIVAFFSMLTLLGLIFGPYYIWILAKLYL